VSAPVTCGTAAGGSTFVFVRLIVKLTTNWNDTTSTHVAGEPCSTEALTDLIYEGLAEPRLFGLGRVLVSVRIGLSISPNPSRQEN
jgi:hypothetical protein